MQRQMTKKLSIAAQVIRMCVDFLSAIRVVGRSRYSNFEGWFKASLSCLVEEGGVRERDITASQQQQHTRHDLAEQRPVQQLLRVGSLGVLSNILGGAQEGAARMLKLHGFG